MKTFMNGYDIAILICVGLFFGFISVVVSKVAHIEDEAQRNYVIEYILWCDKKKGDVIYNSNKRIQGCLVRGNR